MFITCKAVFLLIFRNVDSDLTLPVCLCVCLYGHIHGRDLYHRDDALLYIAYVMLIWVAPIPADRCHCSLWP